MSLFKLFFNFILVWHNSDISSEFRYVWRYSQILWKSHEATSMQSQSKNHQDKAKYCKCSFCLANSFNSEVPPLFCELWQPIQNFPILNYLSPRKDASWMNRHFHPSSWVKDCFSFLSPSVLILNVPSNWALKLETKRRKYVTTNPVSGLFQTPLTL